MRPFVLDDVGILAQHVLPKRCLTLQQVSSVRSAVRSQSTSCFLGAQSVAKLDRGYYTAFSAMRL